MATRNPPTGRGCQAAPRPLSYHVRLRYLFHDPLEPIVLTHRWLYCGGRVRRDRPKMEQAYLVQRSMSDALKILIAASNAIRFPGWGAGAEPRLHRQLAPTKLDDNLRKS